MAETLMEARYGALELYFCADVYGFEPDEIDHMKGVLIDALNSDDPAQIRRACDEVYLLFHPEEVSA